MRRSGTLLLVGVLASLAACAPPAGNEAKPVDTTLPETAAAPVAAEGVVEAEVFPELPEGSVEADVETIAPAIEPEPEPEPVRTSPLVITNPDWLRRPTDDDISRYYPDRAQRMEAEGRATISCTVNARGTLESCSVTSEEPGDMGFGDAALKISKLYKMRPQSEDGQPVDGGLVRVPIRFSLPRG